MLLHFRKDLNDRIICSYQCGTFISGKVVFRKGSVDVAIRRKCSNILLCIVLAVFLVTVVFSMADMAIRMETSNQLNKNGNCHIMVKDISPETAISAILNTAVTRNTARTMHKIVMRFCRLRTLAEIGIRLR